MVKLGWATLVVVTLVAAFVISMFATKETTCSRRGYGGSGQTTCETIYWFNR